MKGLSLFVAVTEQYFTLTPKPTVYLDIQRGELSGNIYEKILDSSQDESKTVFSMLSNDNSAATWNGKVECFRKDRTSFFGFVSISFFRHPDHGKTMISLHQNIENKLAGGYVTD